MSDGDFYPPRGQQVTSSQNIPVTGEQNPGQTMPQQQSVPTTTSEQQYVPPGQRSQNMPVGKQTTQQQYTQTNQQPVNQMQYGQQQMPQQQYYPQQYYQQQMPMPGQAIPQYNPQMLNPQPMPGQMIGPSPSPFLSTPLQQWTTGLFDCAQDLESCLITTFFPCITFGQVAELTDRGMSSCMGAGLIYGLLLYFTGFHWVYSWLYRTRLRASYSLVEDPCPDCLVHFFCDTCALCQEYRELKNRGFNMQLGWVGNMQLKAQMEAAGNVPPPVQGMAR